MGLLYTKLHLDFEPDQWRQVSSSPPTFESLHEEVFLEIMDTAQKSYRIQFKKGGRLNVLPVVGKFRLTWEDEDVIG